MTDWKMPERIFLQPHMHPEVTWCVDKIEDTDIEYILLGTHKKKIAELEDERDKLLSVNHSVAVCAAHTADITISDELENNCLWCQIQKLEAEVERLHKIMQEAVPPIEFESNQP